MRGMGADGGRARRRRDALLATYVGPEVERVRAAIVTLAHGDDAELEILVTAARTDYRDVLAWEEQRRTGRKPPEVDMTRLLAGLGEVELEPPASSTGNVDVVIVAVGERQLDVLKTARRATGLGLAEVQALLGRLPFRVRVGLAPEDGAWLRAALEAAGAAVELR